MGRPTKAKATFKQPLQQRSRDSLKRVYEATNSLLKDKDFDKISIAEISKSAGVAVGSIYQRFGSKNQLLWLMYDAYLDEATERFSALSEAQNYLTLEQKTKSLIALVIDLFSDHRGVIKSLLLRYRQLPETVPENLSKQIETAYQGSARFLVGQDTTPEVAKRAAFAVSLILAVCREQILFRSNHWEQSQPYSKDELEHYLCTSVLAVLNGHSSNRNGQ